MVYSTISNHSFPKSCDASSAAAISLRAVSKRFYYDSHRTNSIREWFIRKVLRKEHSPRPAGFTLKNVTLSIGKGEAVALIGNNGSGKSTLIRLMAGIYQPSSGEVELAGRMAPVMDLGAGFHPELSGAENIVIYASVLGLSREFLARRFNDIVAFSGIEEFLEMPIKHYSTGMQARLALSVALHTEPDVLALDEALSVGDQDFRGKVKCVVDEYLARGGTLILASHSLDAASEVCGRAIWLEKGRLVMDDEIHAVIEKYSASRHPG